MTPTKDPTNEQLNDIMATKIMKFEGDWLGVGEGEAVWLKPEDGSCIKNKDWNPTTNLTQAMECFDKMHLLGYWPWLESLEQRKKAGVYFYRVILRNATVDAQSFKDLPRAICKACAEAVGAK